MLIEPARKDAMKILDIGGTADFWRALPGLYRDPNVSITVVNLGTEERRDENIHVVDGDACALPFDDNSFDIVHSNSVIEHVGHWREMEQMAKEVRRLAPQYFVQTPNVWFPVEPHFKLPFVHWLPEQTRSMIVQATRRSRKFRDAGEATRYVQRISLLSATQLQCLFPDAHIWRERVLGLTKSLVAERFPTA
ncbi:class I SAM-dependent methyltransferase [Sphingopyxis panaciterrulae]|uniref:2-polyprenyl-3-methyl-5-hydroxy-6-metoxy-1, 4-benzoquinol methylase n=1 Tax=Sphingopyxis panaciterrulae TaxID=462372 RepID=A0A7W9B7C0_9SPHN|nr:class I SAM-dependent methyltransferase [Sphingopyxis panaciterrulae]MBB5707605.1 2-polyprenyl-3-methyl-5-hydroxy-6-metoxy-1,4-benzoquinol methylase [Sphingopyxis panaciterrulae]